jgi:D-tyrosyl-tRNA(Tyr) deacylase
VIAVVQRVLSASVVVGGKSVGAIDKGLVILVAVQRRDTVDDAAWLASRVVGLRVFEDTDEKMNLSCADVGGKLLVVSNFTVAARTSKGRRPSFDNAAPFEIGRELYQVFIGRLQDSGIHVETGSYGEAMAVNILNDGPITLIVESPE